MVNDSLPSIEAFGKHRKNIPVALSTRFLEHFSEQLYSSPNKAFEELVANAWDANARSSYIFLPEDNSAQDASVYVLDDGESMDDAGLEDLWKVAYSNKVNQQVTSGGRVMIGKFGIGKLATYVLANKLTYVCKASDGIIRAVTMDYSKLDTGKQNLINELSLDLRETNEPELKKLLEGTSDGKKIHDLIAKHIPAPRTPEWENEFGGPPSPKPSSTGTWTLVVLSSLKQRGKEIKRGIVRRMLQSALPLGAELNIILNAEVLASKKSALPLIADWEIGPDLGINEVSLPAREGAEEDEEPEKISVKLQKSPYPHAEIDGIGIITGRVKLFRERISGGKSEEHGASNGFFVNVRGRVTNSDPHFGEKDLSHSVWSRFRMTVRADALNDLLSVNREQFTDDKRLRVFKAFLRQCFNKARTEYEKQDKWADSGMAIVQSYGMLPLLSFRDFVEDHLTEPGSSLEIFDATDNREEELKKYKDATQNDVREVLKGVDFSQFGVSAPLVKYSLQNRKILVNSDHPFVKEHSEDAGEKAAIKDAILVDLLTDVHAHDLGIDSVQLEELRQKRDRIARMVAKIHRRSGAQIAYLLREVSKHPDWRALEIIVGDALEYLGLEVTRIGGSGEPEGIAKAKLPPDKEGRSQGYSFSYDAKSSQSGRAQTGNCNVAGLTRHRDSKDVDYILLVAPDFQSGALEEECEKFIVTPIRAADLGNLLLLSAEYGAIPLTKLEELFDCYTPDAVSGWVTNLQVWMKDQRKLTLGNLIDTLETLEDGFPDTVSVSVLADRCRTVTKQKVTETDVRRLLAGLQIIVPDLIQVENDRVVINAHPAKLAEAITGQMQKIKGADSQKIAPEGN